MRRPGRVQRLALAAGAAASLAFHGAAAAEPAGSLRASASVGGDSNPRRVVGDGEPDLVASLLLDTAGRLPLGPLDLAGSYLAAGRKFLLLSTEDTLAQEVAAEAGWRPLGSVQLAVDGRVKDRRGGPRRYTDLQSYAALRWRAVPELEVELRGGAHRFIDWAVFEYSYSSPDAGVRVRFRFDRHHTLSLGGDLEHRKYNALAVLEPTQPDPPEIIREDGVLTAAASYSYRGPFQVSVGYQYFDAASNSFGETVSFHRVEVTLGMPLPWDLFAFAQLALQLGEYPDGVFLSPNLPPLEEDDERHSSVSVKLVRPLGDRVDLDLRYGLWTDVFRKNAISYFRQAGSIGVTFRL
ncbi:MAG TPA: hypothetical protein VFA20_13955 [Myxococcaceae bacterium]|nr:hypothetical protein [Myxococcaceae bacterium]